MRVCICPFKIFGSILRDSEGALVIRSADLIDFLGRRLGYTSLSYEVRRML